MISEIRASINSIGYVDHESEDIRYISRQLASKCYTDINELKITIAKDGEEIEAKLVKPIHFIYHYSKIAANTSFAIKMLLEYDDSDEFIFKKQGKDWQITISDIRYHRYNIKINAWIYLITDDSTKFKDNVHIDILQEGVESLELDFSNSYNDDNKLESFLDCFLDKRYCYFEHIKYNNDKILRFYKLILIGNKKSEKIVEKFINNNLCLKIRFDNGEFTYIDSSDVLAACKSKDTNLFYMVISTYTKFIGKKSNQVIISSSDNGKCTDSGDTWLNIEDIFQTKTKMRMPIFKYDIETEELYCCTDDGTTLVLNTKDND